MRARVALPIKVRAADFCDGDLVQIAETLNSSRAGLYFPSELDRYHAGMRLRFIVPFHAASSAAELEEIGEVIRIDRHSTSRYGIAIQRPIQLHARGPVVTPHGQDLTAPRAERRSQTRFPFVASAEMMDAQTRTLLRARTFDLSLSGCYVDTLNPFPVGAILYLWIHRENDSLQARTIVRSQHLGSGMGLAFTDLSAEESSIVRSWLLEPDPNRGYFLSKEMEEDKHMSQVYDALRKAEQSRKVMPIKEELPEVVQPTVALALNPAESTFACLGPDLQIRGEISGNESLVIEGRVDGLISIGDCRLAVGPTAHVRAKILAGDVVVHGTLDGTVCANKRIVILSTATVSGELTAPRIMIEEGAYVKASVQILGEAPSVPSSVPLRIADNS